MGAAWHLGVVTSNLSSNSVLPEASSSFFYVCPCIKREYGKITMEYCEDKNYVMYSMSAKYQDSVGKRQKGKRRRVGRIRKEAGDVDFHLELETL